MRIASIQVILSITLGLSLLFLGTAGLLAAEGDEQEATKLGIKPVDTSENYFTRTASPGEVLQFEVELSNHGASANEARTFAADVYSLVNGGFGVRLDGEPTSGTTEWLDYEAETFEMEPETAERRTFTVTVPEDVKPGEYLTALVIQNANPVGGPTTGIGFNQTNRIAIAVAITVPGEMQAALAIGDAGHEIKGGRSVLTVEVENPSTMHLSSEGEFLLTTADGDEVLRKPVAMSTVYAGTETHLEVPFTEMLEPGDYLVSLNLANVDEGVEAELVEGSITVPEVEQPAAAPAPADGSTSGGENSGQVSGAETSQSGGSVQDASVNGFPVWMLAATAIGALVAGAGVAFGVVMFMRRRRPGKDGTSSPVETAPVPAAPDRRAEKRLPSQAQPRMRQLGASRRPAATNQQAFSSRPMRDLLQQSQLKQTGNSGD